MRIEIVSSFTPDIVLEKVKWSGTFASYMDAEAPGWRERESQLISVEVDGAPCPVDRWGDEVAEDSVVRVTVLPQGGLFKSLGSIIGKIFNAVFGWLAPSASGRSYDSPSQGRQLETAQGRANTAKLGDVVPELFGRFRRFPDYLTPPRRYFENAREQWLEFHACIGPGQYSIDGNDVKVGDTPLNSLGADAQFQIFGPGESLENVPTRDAWHSVEEVGGTSSGTPGLELSTELANRDNSDPGSYTFSWDNVNRSEGHFPTGWGGGTIVNIEYPRPYQVVTIHVPETETDPAYDISEITGYFGHVDSNVDDLIALGPIGSTTQYRVRTSVVVSGNIKTLRLETYPAGVPVLLPAGPAQVLRFGSDRQRTIITYGETAMTVVPGGFEDATVAGALVRFAGGTIYGEWTSEFAASPGNELSGVLEFDVFFPGGLAYITNSGGLDPIGVGVEFQYRNMSGGPRVTVSRYYEQATLDQIGFTERIHISNDRWMVRMRRVGSESTSTQIQDKVHWYGMKSLLASRWSYPDWTTIMVRLRSGGRIAAQAENQINLIATRVLPRLQSDGSWSAPQPTRDIASFVRYIVHSIGYTDADLDMEELARLHSIWVSRWDAFDHVFDLTTVKAALDTVLAAGMAELTLSDGQIRPVREGVRTVFEQSYSPQNMTTPLRRTFRARTPEDADGVDVEYTSENTWTREVVQCRLPGDNGFKVEKVTIDGVLDRTRAWRIGMRRRRELKYRRWEYSFGTELDALNSEYKSYVPLFTDMPGYGQSAILEHIEGVGQGNARLTVSEPMRWEEGQSHVVAYRRPDGTLAGPFPAQPGDDEYEIIAPIPQPWPVVTLTREPPHVYFGTTERFCFPALITEISPQGNESMSVTAVNYDARVYADDDNAPT